MRPRGGICDAQTPRAAALERGRVRHRTTLPATSGGACQGGRGRRPPGVARRPEVESRRTASSAADPGQRSPGRAAEAAPADPPAEEPGADRLTDRPPAARAIRGRRAPIGFRTRGQPAAVRRPGDARDGMPHALLLVRPARGRQDDARRGRRRRAAVSRSRPARCGPVASAVPVGPSSTATTRTLHRLAPTGAGAIPIGGREERGVRDLVRDLALLPVEGGARVGIIRGADRMTEDAQSAFLKTLEEPPLGAVLAPHRVGRGATCRRRSAPAASGSGSARCRAARSERCWSTWASPTRRSPRGSRGCPGPTRDAVALARAPESLTIRSEMSRTLLDLRSGPPGPAAHRRVSMRPAPDRRAPAPVAPRRAEGSPPGRRGAERRAAAPPGRGHPPDRRGPALVRRRAAKSRLPSAERAAIGAAHDLARRRADLALVELGEPAGPPARPAR